MVINDNSWEMIMKMEWNELRIS